MTTFGLVHGAWHGGWWDRVVTELESLGHRGVAPDLPCDDPTAGLDQYAQTVCDALDGTGEDLVVVGHSFGGVTIPLVAARRPVRRLVFLAALLPRPGRTVVEALAESPSIPTPPDFGEGQQEVDGNGSRWLGEAAVRFFYQDCDPADAAEATARLRPQCWLPGNETWPLDAFPDVPLASIVCADDRAIDPEWSRWAARGWLGVEPIEIPGGHSPFLTRPRELALLLHGLAP